jgi:hypothetical protein
VQEFAFEARVLVAFVFVFVFVFVLLTFGLSPGFLRTPLSARCGASRLPTRKTPSSRLVKRLVVSVDALV